MGKGSLSRGSLLLLVNRMSVVHSMGTVYRTAVSRRKRERMRMRARMLESIFKLGKPTVTKMHQCSWDLCLANIVGDGDSQAKQSYFKALNSISIAGRETQGRHDTTQHKTELTAPGGEREPPAGDFICC